MNLALAPMRGLTDFTFRNAYYKIFNQIDLYYTPFIEIDNIGTKSLDNIFREILPKNILDDKLKKKIIPQIITKNSKYLKETINILEKYGYNCLNLNLGCPYPQSVNKGRGAGLLFDKNNQNLIEIISFLENETPDNFTYSLKIRTGEKAFSDNLSKFDFIKDCKKLSEIIIHPRYMNMIYKGKTNLNSFIEYANYLKDLNKKIKISYNGDITNIIEYNNLLKETLEKNIPIHSVMIGRGIMGDLTLPHKIKHHELIDNKKLNIKLFMKELLLGIETFVEGDKNILFKLKEKWIFFSNCFEDSKKVYKIIKKCKNKYEYDNGITLIFIKYKLKDES